VHDRLENPGAISFPSMFNREPAATSKIRKKQLGVAIIKANNAGIKIQQPIMWMGKYAWRTARSHRPARSGNGARTYERACTLGGFPSAVTDGSVGFQRVRSRSETTRRPVVLSHLCLRPAPGSVDRVGCFEVIQLTTRYVQVTVG
jgi:hypothetical protein